MIGYDTESHGLRVEASPSRAHVRTSRPAVLFTFSKTRRASRNERRKTVGGLSGFAFVVRHHGHGTAVYPTQTLGSIDIVPDSDYNRKHRSVKELGIAVSDLHQHHAGGSLDEERFGPVQRRRSVKGRHSNKQTRIPAGSAQQCGGVPRIAREEMVGTVFTRNSERVQRLKPSHYPTSHPGNPNGPGAGTAATVSGLTGRSSVQHTIVLCIWCERLYRVARTSLHGSDDCVWRSRRRKRTCLDGAHSAAGSPHSYFTTWTGPRSQPPLGPRKLMERSGAEQSWGEEAVTVANHAPSKARHFIWPMPIFTATSTAC